MDKQYEYSKLRFGYSEAEIEGAREPDLLIDGFWDLKNTINDIENGHKYLVLGYKGSGKSAIAEHMRLKAESEPNLFVSTASISDFPFEDFNRIVGGDDDPQSRLPLAWSWVILIRLIGLLAEDNGAFGVSAGEFPQALHVIKQLGLLPSPELKKIVRVSSSKTFKLQIPLVFEGSLKLDPSKADERIPLFTERLKSIVASFKSESKHFLFIDGLDDILTQRDIQYEALSSLILEVSRLNLLFERVNTPIKVVLLCRTDLYERIPGANKNKIRQDSSVFLDWYHDPREPKSSQLVALSRNRAKLVYPKIKNISAVFFPSVIDHKSINTFLFELTRHTPRDYLRLLSYIQHFANVGKVTRAQILSGTREYSIQYFLPEVKDELVGYVDQKDVKLVFDLVGSLRAREFTYKKLCLQLSDSVHLNTQSLKTALHALFECSAIGNVQSRPSGSTYFTFKYRNPHSVFNIHERIILHKGLWKAMNLV